MAPTISDPTFLCPPKKPKHKILVPKISDPKIFSPPKKSKTEIFENTIFQQRAPKGGPKCQICLSLGPLSTTWCCKMIFSMIFSEFQYDQGCFQTLQGSAFRWCHPFFMRKTTTFTFLQNRGSP